MTQRIYPGDADAAQYVDKGSVASGTVTFTAADAGHQKVTATGNITLAVTWAGATATTEFLLLELVNFGARTITWPTINWIKPDGTTTTTFSSNGVTLQPNGTDWCLLWSQGGVTYGKFVR